MLALRLDASAMQVCVGVAKAMTLSHLLI